MNPSDDMYQRQIRATVGKVSADAVAGDLNSRLLGERLSLEHARQQRLSAIQGYATAHNYPNTLRGRTEAMEAMDESDAWAAARRNFGLSDHNLYAIRYRLPFSPRWRAEEIRHWVQSRSD